MTKVRNERSLAIVSDVKNGSPTSFAVAGLAMLITLLAGTARNSVARRPPQARSADLKLSVHVYNYAGSPADILRIAESETGRIFARAGVHLDWHEYGLTALAESADPACDTPLTPSDLHLRIVKSVNLKRVQVSPETGGFTIGNLALVQMQYLQELPTPSEYIRGLMLGRVIAHEFGHALLGPGHSSQGIMRARWGKELWEFTGANDMVFTPDQEKALRLAVKARHAEMSETIQTDAHQSRTRPADLKMSVLVYNYAGSSVDIVRLAESETGRIFARAGIQLEWHECGGTALAESADPICATPQTSSDLVLRIVKRVNLVGLHASAEAIGFTIDNLATVQMEPLQKFQSHEGLTVCFSYQILGRAMAHEFGHVLLGPGHSSQGIMRPGWGEKQWEFTSANDMVFTPGQEKALRLAVKTRLAEKPDAFQVDAQEPVAPHER